MVKMWHEGRVESRAAFVAIGIVQDGHKAGTVDLGRRGREVLAVGAHRAA